MEENFTAKNQVVFTQQCDEGAKEQFMSVFSNLVKYAEENKLETPKKQNLLTKVLRNGLPLMTPEEFFK